MNGQKLSQQVMLAILIMFLLVGCGAAATPTPTPEPTATLVPPTATPVPPTDTPEPTSTSKPTSCEEVEGICLELTFDGGSCTYDGPTDFKTGSVTLNFLNESEGRAAVNLVRHTGDETIQDMKDTFVEEPSTGHHPYWTTEIYGVWKAIDAGESHTWEGALEPGIHTMVCARMTPLGVWFGTGLTVED